MTFVHSDTNHIIYDFTWEDAIGEHDFLTSYGDYTVSKFRSVADGEIIVYIKKQEEE